MKDKDLRIIARSILDKLYTIRMQHSDFNPTVYVGKCSDFNETAKRHLNIDNYHILLRVAEGDSKSVAELENLLIGLFKNDTMVRWKLKNEKLGSASNPCADKVYICFDSSIKSDELEEWDEVYFLGTEYPIQI